MPGHVTGRLLALRAGAIGDFILTLPALAALRARFRGAELGLVAQPRLTALASASGLADQAFSIEAADVARLFADGAAPSPEWSGWLRSCDLAVSFLHDPPGRVAANLTAAGVRRVLAHDPIVHTGHAADHFVSPLAQLGAEVPDVAIPRLTVPESARIRGRRLLAACGEHVLLLHPGSGSARKNWPAERFAELARRVRAELGVQPAFVAGEADEDARAQLQRLAPEMPFLPPCDLTELAGALACASAYVGNDSGVTHLAAAVAAATEDGRWQTEIPRVVALFGPTDPAVWGPRGKRVQIVRAASGDMRDIAARDVLARIWPYSA